MCAALACKKSHSPSLPFHPPHLFARVRSGCQKLQRRRLCLLISALALLAAGRASRAAVRWEDTCGDDAPRCCSACLNTVTNTGAGIRTRARHVQQQQQQQQEQPVPTESTTTNVCSGTKRAGNTQACRAVPAPPGTHRCSSCSSMLSISCCTPGSSSPSRGFTLRLKGVWWWYSAAGVAPPACDTGHQE